jgi:hypothetical protein
MPPAFALADGAEAGVFVAGGCTLPHARGRGCYRRTTGVGGETPTTRHRDGRRAQPRQPRTVSSAATLAACAVNRCLRRRAATSATVGQDEALE